MVSRMLRMTLRRAMAASAAALVGGATFVASQRPAIADDSGVTATADPSLTAPEPVNKANVALADKLAKGALTQSPRARQMAQFVLRLQDDITSTISAVDGKEFRTDMWQRQTGGGGGRTMVMADGNVFEKAGIGVSVVHGHMPPAAVRQMNSRGKALGTADGPIPFFVAGVSLVFHPRNPMAPTVHANFRYFEVVTKDAETGESRRHWWYGGGSDLTPCYLFESDAVHFHDTLKAACDPHGEDLYPKFKKWCDDYFDNTHRGEKRGIGGIFFDDFGEGFEKVTAGADGVFQSEDELAGAPFPVTKGFSFVRSAGDSFLPAFVPLVLRRHNMAFTEEQKRWQQIRRGRYVEFNLVHDRGTKFGLHMPNSRIESILMSLPETARWEYCHSPEAGSAEAAMLDVLRNPKEWAGRTTAAQSVPTGGEAAAAAAAEAEEDAAAEQAEEHRSGVIAVAVMHAEEPAQQPEQAAEDVEEPAQEKAAAAAAAGVASDDTDPSLMSEEQLAFFREQALARIAARRAAQDA